MKTALLLFFFLLVFQFSEPIHAQTAQRNPIAQTNPVDEEMDLFLFGIVTIGLLVMCLCLGAGIALVVFVLLALFVLATWGVVSTSVIVGLHTKSFQKGFRLFVKLSATLAGGITGALTLVLLNFIVHWFSLWKSIAIGLTAGLLAGWLLGVCTVSIVRKLTQLFRQKLAVTSKNT